MGGTWKSIQIEGLDAVLTTFKIPEALHAMVKKAERTISIATEGKAFSIKTTTALGGRSLDQTTVNFELDTPFKGEERLGGIFHGVARYNKASGDSKMTDSELVIEKKFSVEEHSITLEEHYQCGVNDSLVVIVRCQGAKPITSQTSRLKRNAEEEHDVIDVATGA